MGTDISIVHQWMNTFDYTILLHMHYLAEAYGNWLTPLAKTLAFLGDKGLIMFLVAFVMLFFKKTRKAGICLAIAVICGALITNLVVKGLVARPRPFRTLGVYHVWWQLVGLPKESAFSFPSGHVTATMAAMTSLCFSYGKKMIPWTVIIVLLMGFSRNYLMVHYPTDVLGGIIAGFLGALVAYYLCQKFYAPISSKFANIYQSLSRKR